MIDFQYEASQNVNIIFNVEPSIKQSRFSISRDENDLNPMISTPVECEGSSRFNCRCGAEVQVNIYLDKVELDESRMLHDVESLDLPTLADVEVKEEPDDDDIFEGVKEEEGAGPTIHEPKVELIDQLAVEEKEGCNSSDLRPSKPPPPPKKKKRAKVPTAEEGKVTKVPRGPNDTRCKTIVERKLDYTLITEQDFKDFYAESKRRLEDVSTPYLEIVDFNDNFKIYLWKPIPRNFNMTSFDTHSYRCDICGRVKKSPGTLIIHRSEHFYNKDLLRCYGCQYQAGTEEETILHVTYCRHNNKERFTALSLRCHDCGQQFTSIKLLKFHEKQHVTDFSKNRKALCDICSKWFPDEAGLKKHQKHKHKVGSLECYHCGKAYPDKRHLLNHLAKQHFPQLATFQCTLCKYCTANQTFLNHHISIVHNKDKLVECKVCGKTLQRNSLKTHLNKHRSHHERKKYFCQVCNKMFFSVCARQTHFASMHTDPETWTNICQPCNKKFATKEKLSLHTKEHHTDRPTCHICLKTFTTKTYLKDHYNLHSGEKPYNCTVCEKSFADRGCLRNHLKNHEAAMGIKLTLNKEEARLKRLNVKFDDQ